MNMRATSILLLLFAAHFAEAQDTTVAHRKFEQYVHVGMNLGALAPVPLPNNIRRIDGWAPQFSPAIAYEMTYRINEKWLVGAAAKLEYKGMTVKDSVAYLHTIITVVDNGQVTNFEGDFTGTNETKANNGYVTFPINAVFDPGRSWRFKLGFYLSFLFDPKFEGTVSNGYIRNGNSLGEKVQISEASFDFKNQLRTFDAGLQGGAAYRLNRNFAIEGNLNWGLRPAFPPSFTGIGFDMYNIFFTLGASYRIR